jgi:hypothetical protein
LLVQGADLARRFANLAKRDFDSISCQCISPPAYVKD